MEGVLAEGGALNFVLKRPQGVQPEWLQSTDNRDFLISFKKVSPLCPPLTTVAMLNQRSQSGRCLPLSRVSDGLFWSG